MGRDETNAGQREGFQRQTKDEKLDRERLDEGAIPDGKWSLPNTWPTTDTMGKTFFSVPHSSYILPAMSCIGPVKSDSRLRVGSQVASLENDVRPALSVTLLAALDSL